MLLGAGVCAPGRLQVLCVPAVLVCCRGQHRTDRHGSAAAVGGAWAGCPLPKEACCLSQAAYTEAHLAPDTGSQSHFKPFMQCINKM